ncbi:hypothetical protein HHI36_000085 [Cryptolaemus montrouzieri]|uniref:Ubiquinone biosynthesis monooxygenase COQ6 n=1 Tax=Cryptolaemus montrouzieri TaxID=559131 RepID=A0ABD2P408_9CUCU
MIRAFITSRRKSLLYSFSIFQNSSRDYSSDKHYDIIIVGGGLIGTTLACALGKNNRLSDKRILLLEAGKKRDWRISEEYSNVVTALNPATFNLFNEIGVWKHIESKRFATVTGMQVWEANSEVMIKFQSDNHQDNIGYIVENNVILNGIWEEVQKLGNVEVVHEALINNYKLRDKHETNELNMKNGSVYTGELLCPDWISIK